MILFGSRESQNDLAITLSWGTVVGAGLQLGIQLPFVFKNSRWVRFGLETALAPVKEIFRNLGPVLVSRGVVQLSAYIDGMIASFLGAAAVASLGYAQTLYLLPIGVFGMSIAAAELPEMSSALGTTEEANSKIRARLQSGQRTIAFFVIPSVAGFLFLGKLIVAALYQTGQFTSDNSLYVWYILIGSTVGLLAATWGRLYSSAFYALRDTRTPLNFAVIRVTLTAVLGILFAFPLRPYLVALVSRVLLMPIPQAAGGEIGIGAVGLTASAGVAAWVEYMLLQRSMARRIGPSHVALREQLKLWGSAALAGILSYALYWRVLSWIAHPRGAVAPILELLVAGAIFGIVYLGITRAMGMPQAKRVLRF
jgi:putative peptidoglycan lipid II flippase